LERNTPIYAEDGEVGAENPQLLRSILFYRVL